MRVGVSVLFTEPTLHYLCLFFYLKLLGRVWDGVSFLLLCFYLVQHYYQRSMHLVARICSYGVSGRGAEFLHLLGVC